MQLVFFRSKYLILICILVFHYFSLLSNSHYCNPSSCGSIHNISFPFRLNTDPQHCGDPDYQLTCEQNRTVLTLHSGKYYVQSINYDNYTVRVVDPGVQQNNICSFPRYALAQYSDESYTYDISAIPHISQPSTLITVPIIFLSCPFPVKSSTFVEMTKECWNKSTESSWGYAYAKLGSLNASDLRISCRVELITMTSWRIQENVSSQKVSLVEIHDALMYGFELSWFPAICKQHCSKGCYLDFKNEIRCAYFLESIMEVDQEQSSMPESSESIAFLANSACSKSIGVVIYKLLIHFSWHSNTTLCNPSSCGSIHNISFPFRLNTDPKHCGNPDYELTCEQNRTVLTLHYSQKYYVQSINYDNYTIRVVDPDVQEANNMCSFPRYAVSRYSFFRYHDGYPYSIARAKRTTYYNREELPSIPLITVPIIFLRCPFPMKSFTFVEITKECWNDKNSSGRNAPPFYPSGGYAYAKVGRLNASDLRISCRVDLITMTSSWRVQENNVSSQINVSRLLEIHDALRYGFELSWFQAVCRQRCWSRECELDDTTNEITCWRNYEQLNREKSYQDNEPEYWNGERDKLSSITVLPLLSQDNSNPGYPQCCAAFSCLSLKGKWIPGPPLLHRLSSQSSNPTTSNGSNSVIIKRRNEKKKKTTPNKMLAFRSKNLVISCVICILVIHYFSLLSNSHYCNPSSCGSIHNISYPFRLDTDPQHCGNPYYLLTCEQNQTVVTIHSQKYFVRAINYNNNTIHVVDPGVQQNNICSFPQYALPKDSLLRYRVYPYEIAYTTYVPVIFMRCPFPMKSSAFVETTKDCWNKSSDSPGGYAYVKLGRLNASDLRISCRVEIITMTTSWQIQENNVSENVSRLLLEIHDALMYGFELSWFPAICQQHCGGSRRCYLDFKNEISCKHYFSGKNEK
nr:rust resistance kinase Lr10-like isoform X1 [Ipomoea batatas]